MDSAIDKFNIQEKLNSVIVPPMFHRKRIYLNDREGIENLILIQFMYPILETYLLDEEF
jgi:hypothetical protein